MNHLGKFATTVNYSSFSVSICLQFIKLSELSNHAPQACRLHDPGITKTT